MPYKKGGSGLNMVVQSLPPGQFIVIDTNNVLHELMCIQEGAVHRYVPGGFCLVCSAGDLSAIHNEVDPLIWHVTKVRSQSLLCWSGPAGGCVNGCT